MKIKIDATKCKYCSGCCNNNSCCSNTSCCSNSSCCTSTSSSSCCNGRGCAEVCPTKALTRCNGKILVDQEKCTLCGSCIDVCPYSAISFK